MPANFNPDVVSAASRDDAEGLATREAWRCEIVLYRSDVVEGLTRLRRKQLVEHPLYGIERERARCQLQLPRRRDDVWTLTRMKDEGVLRPEHVSIGKLHNVNAALRVARTARQVLGANGVTLEYPVIRHMNNLESVVTYEGTADIHTLVIGGALTGIQAFR